MSLKQFMGVDESADETPRQNPAGKKEETTTISEPETGEIAKFMEKCRENRENWAYISAVYVCDFRIDGKREWLNVNHTLERPFKDEGDSYGGMWGMRSYPRDKISEFLDDTGKFVQKLLEQPYKENLKGSEACFLRDIKDENIRVFLTDSARKLLEENATDAGEYLSKVHEMKGRTATDEELELCEKYDRMEEETSKLEKRLNDIRETVCGCFGISTIYGTHDSRKGLNHFTDTTDFNALRREYAESNGLISGYETEMKMIRNYFNGDEKHLP